MLPAGADSPIEGPCKAVDFELEMVRTQRQPPAAAAATSGMLVRPIDSTGSQHHVLAAVLGTQPPSETGCMKGTAARLLQQAQQHMQTGAFVLLTHVSAI